jgi:7-carboxy-7-deazaguanine synthase
MKLKVHEIFYSIQGETTTSGFTSVFIRLAGCNLNCSWCDTQKAREGGTDMDVDEIIDKVAEFKPFHHITLTGGEPFIQNASFYLLQRLSGEGYLIQVETNGSVLLNTIPYNIRVIMDIKTPSSGEENSFDERNIRFLRKTDEIKFVISIMEDYEFAKRFIEEKLKGVETVINLSPAAGLMEPWVLANLIIKDKLQVRLNIQLHKTARFA